MSQKFDADGRVISIRTAPYFSWGKSCHGWWLKKRGQFSAIEETMPQGSSEIKHYHHSVEQFFYVLEGELFVEFGGVGNVLKNGDSITILPGVVHNVSNRSKKEVRFLVISSPDLNEDRVDLDESK